MRASRGCARPRRVGTPSRPAGEVCGGSDTARATQQMVMDLVASGRTRLLVIGGSPNTRRTLRDAVAGSPVEVTFVEGDRPTGVKRAKEMAEAADVVVIWANTLLDHKVSQPFTNAAPAKTFTCARRGVAALAEEVSRHVEASGGQAVAALSCTCCPRYAPAARGGRGCSRRSLGARR